MELVPIWLTGPPLVPLVSFSALESSNTVSVKLRSIVSTLLPVELRNTSVELYKLP